MMRNEKQVWIFLNQNYFYPFKHYDNYFNNRQNLKKNIFVFLHIKNIIISVEGVVCKSLYLNKSVLLSKTFYKGPP